jgi:hypothetical protein
MKTKYGVPPLNGVPRVKRQIREFMHIFPMSEILEEMADAIAEDANSPHVSVVARDMWAAHCKEDADILRQMSARIGLRTISEQTVKAVKVEK